MRTALLASLAFAACSLIWGSTWLAIKVGYGGIGAFTGVALRFGLAAGMMALLALARGHPLRLRGPALRLALLVAALMFVGDYGLIYWGEQYLTSGLTAVLFATMPFFVGAFAVPWLAEPVTARKLGGALLGFLGLAAMFRESLQVDVALLGPMLAIVGAAACAAATNVAMKRTGGAVPGDSLFATAMGAGSLVLALVAVASGERLALPSTGLAWASVGYLAAVGTVTGFLIFWWLLQRAEAVKVSLITVLTPIVALALGAALLGERFGAWELAGSALVLVGVAVAVTAPGVRARDAAPAPEPAAAD